MEQKQQNIAVLGAGIMGLSAAYALMKDGHSVTVYDPAGFPAKNASAMAGGMLAPWSEIEHLSGAWFDAALEGLKFWADVEFDTGYTQNGSLILAHPEDRHMLERFKTHLPNLPEDVEFSDRFPNALSLPGEAHLDPALTLTNLCENLKNRGATFIASRLEDESNYDHIIDCRGMGAADDLPNLRGVKGETLIVENPDFELDQVIRLMHPRYPLYIVPRANNVFMIGATIIESQDETDVSLRSAMELMSALYSLHPSFGDAKILEIQAGIRPAFPNNLPRLIQREKRIYANGMFRHGYLLAPVLASCIKDMIMSRKNGHENLFRGEENEDHHQRKSTRLRDAA